MAGEYAVKRSCTEYLGSYQSYYKRNANIDDRLNELEESWFKDKRVIDIGCNEGAITIAVAERFSPRCIVGIDIDQRLIDAGNSAVKRAKFQFSKENVSCDRKESSLQPTMQPRKSQFFVPRSVAVSKSLPVAAAAVASSPSSTGFPFNITFRFDDFRTMSLLSTTIYDTVMCLSVTKWIHLNGGDCAILNFFKKLHAHLKDHGFLVIEYQHWQSYVKNKSASAIIKQIFPDIQIRPEAFEAIFLQEFGFELVSRKGASLDTAKGFCRPILILRKQPQSRLLPLFSASGVDRYNSTDIGDECTLSSMEIAYIREKYQHVNPVDSDVCDASTIVVGENAVIVEDCASEDDEKNKDNKAKKRRKKSKTKRS